MNDDKWLNVIDTIEEMFDVTERKKEKIQSEDGNDEEHEWVIFEKKGIKMKLERVSKPRILDRKEHFSRRAGTSSQTEYIVSDTEKSHHVHLYRENGSNGWEEIDTTTIENL